MEITDNIIAKRLFRGFIYLHILYHASVEPFYGSWMLEELSNHGYKLSPGTLYQSSTAWRTAVCCNRKAATYRGGSANTILLPKRVWMTIGKHCNS